MPSPARQLPRIRQVVLTARDLDPVANRVRDALHLGEPFSVRFQPVPSQFEARRCESC